MGLEERTEKIKMHAFKRDWNFDFTLSISTFPRL